LKNAIKNNINTTIVITIKTIRTNTIRTNALRANTIRTNTIRTNVIRINVNKQMPIVKLMLGEHHSIFKET